MSFSLSDTNQRDQESYMIFGGINDDQYSGSLYDLPLVTNYWWAVEVTSFYYGGKQLKKYERYKKGISIFRQP